jgi:DNA polymerase (family 10)
MVIRNADIAAIFDEIADILAIQGDNPFRIRAYQNAARIIGGYNHDIATMLQGGGHLPKLPGIGPDLAGKIGEIAERGDCALLRRLRKQVPPGIVALLKIPGLGPKRVQVLYRDLGIKTAERLLAAAREGRIAALPRFGAKLQQKLLHGAETHLQAGHRVLLARAAPVAERLATFLQSVPGVSEVNVAGSFRRMRETIGDLDILAIASASSPVMNRFAGYDEVQEVLSQGPTRGSVVLRSGLQVDLRVMEAPAYGAALVYFTGSKAHNIAIRRRAQLQGLKISEYGVFRGKARIAGDTETSVYRALGLPLIPAELREDRGEIEAAAAGRLPRLVELRNLKGDLHAHTRATDGQNTLEEMAAAAAAAGLQYLAITEHSRHLAIAHGLDANALLRHIEKIDTLNQRLKGVTLLKGIEVDILENGRLDLPDEVLARLDLVIAAVHSGFELSRQKQTQRILRALERPCVTMLAHPTGRLLQEREPYDIDMGAIIAAAQQRGCFLELNAQPQRLDLLDVHCRQARDQGVLISINSDAHSTADFGNLRFGIGQARRGWLEAKDVLNTRSLTQLKPLLKSCFRR